MRKGFYMALDEKVLTPLLIAAIHIGDLFVKTIGKSIAHRAACRLKNHDWEPVAGNDFLRYCIRCGDIDDIRRAGIDSERRENRIRNRRRYNRRRERRERREQRNKK